MNDVELGDEIMRCTRVRHSPLFIYFWILVNAVLVVPFLSFVFADAACVVFGWESVRDNGREGMYVFW